MEGESPLHVLARKPNVFRSSTHFPFPDSIIYRCVLIDKLKKQHLPRKRIYRCTNGANYPENCTTCIDIFLLLVTPIYKSIKAGLEKHHSSSTDEENPSNRKNNPKKMKTFGDHRVVFRLGFWGVRRIQVKKERHSYALQLMNEMIESESSYKYQNNEQNPGNLESQYSGRVLPPSTLPLTDDQPVAQLNPETNGGRNLSSDQPQNQNEKQRDENENGSVKMDMQVLAKRETPILVAAKMGILEMVQKILDTFPVAIQDLDSSGKNVLMLAAINRHTPVFDYFVEKKLPGFVFHQFDDQGNTILHLLQCWENFYHGVFLVLLCRCNGRSNESCSVIAALVATVAFATSTTVPGRLNEDTGHPVLENQTAFDVFSITSLVALTLAVTALVFFLSIITLRCQERDFKKILPRKLLLGLSSLFASIVAMLISFCVGHTFILKEKLRYASVPMYGVVSVPVAFFALA
ncbi:Hypothetical predicted protein [Olea europaea subsp. europaea]|uniref:PGG domain-containing protein n=1 Tax=Olea europaea subsp. europaea TaxID=158383 RepID=A0A8S0SQ90_OLEEU|nr:Hypothetical predicted protein [Olea europaea subsp. europaea]